MGFRKLARLCLPVIRNVGLTLGSGGEVVYVTAGLFASNTLTDEGKEAIFQ